MITSPDLMLLAYYLYLKLALFVSKERFGVALQQSTKKEPKAIASLIMKLDKYLGYVAYTEIYMDGAEPNPEQAIAVLKELISNHKDRPEAYIKLWQVYSTFAWEAKHAPKISTETIRNKEEFHTKAVEIAE